MINISQKGIDFIKELEGCKLKAYLDGGGVPTIGYGHTSKVFMGQSITLAIAEVYLKEDIVPAASAVRALIDVPLFQNQFDALCSFVFNIGTGAFRSSTMRIELNSNRFEMAAKQFLLWKYDNGKIVKGLLARRKREMNLFLLGDYGVNTV